MEKEVINFDPAAADLQKIVALTSTITADNLEDKEQMDVVRHNRIALKNARIAIEKKGKELRADALEHQRQIIAKEKELIGIIGPEEDRLAALEQAAKDLVVKMERMEKLPIRKERLGWLNGSAEMPSDDDLLGMDSNEFEAYYNRCVALKNERDAAEADRVKSEKDAFDEMNRRNEQAAIDAENKRIKEEQDAREADLDARKKEIDDAAEKVRREKEIKDAEDRARIQAVEDEKHKAEEKKKADEETEEKLRAEKAQEAARLEKKKAYQEFLKSHGWTEETKASFKVEETEAGYVLLKRLGIFAK